MRQYRLHQRFRFKNNTRSTKRVFFFLFFMAYGLQTAIWENRRRTIFLVMLLPVVTVVAVYLVFLIPAFFSGTPSEVGISSDISVPAIAPWKAAAQAAHPIAVGIFLACAVWAAISFIFQRQAIFAWAGAKPLARKDAPEIYNIVENLCISRGLPMPKIGILEDDSLNAFATGWNLKKDAWIVFSRGILQKLNRQEIEAVAAHELTHIISKDSLLMVAVIVYAGAVLAIGEIIIRTSRGGDKKEGNGNLMLVGVALYVIGLLVLPLVRLALSRRREYLADAGAVVLTKNKESMIAALQKINTDSRIESIQKAAISDMCIADPFLEPLQLSANSTVLPRKRASGFGAWVAGWFSTHPSIEARIKALQGY